MAISVKTIKGRKYAYHQTSKRIAGKVKTTSKYLGPVGRAMSAVNIAVNLAVKPELREQLTRPLDEIFEHKEKTAEGPFTLAFGDAEPLTASGWTPEAFEDEAMTHASDSAEQPSESESSVSAGDSQGSEDSQQ